MIGVLILSSTFFILILIFVLVISINVKNTVAENNRQSKKIFKDLSERIDETQNLFRHEVKDILKNINKIIDKS